MYSAVFATAAAAGQSMSVQLQWMITVIAAVVSGSLVALASHPRPRLRLSAGVMTVDDAVRLWRANDQKNDWHSHRLIPAFVQLTNVGNGAAFDVELSGTNCAPACGSATPPLPRHSRTRTISRQLACRCGADR